MWTRKLVSALLEQQWGVTLGVPAVGRLLDQLDITPHDPLRRAYARDPVAIERWTTEVFPRLRTRAKRRPRWSSSTRPGSGRTRSWDEPWGVRGHTPEGPTSGRRQSLNAISAVNARGAFWYELSRDRLNATRFVAWLQHVLRGRRGRVCLVLDGHPAHIATRVAHHAQSLRGRLELHFLPGYAPDLNPDAFVWNHLKRQGGSKPPLRNDESLRSLGPT